MRTYFKTILLVACGCICCSCEDDTDSEHKREHEDIAEEIVGEWVFDHPAENEWQSMKFVEEGHFFCYSNKKENWTEKLKDINKGNYGVKGNVVSAANGSTYLDMTVKEINGYEFTGRLNESTVDFQFHKVVMRTHLNFGESVVPPAADLVDATITGYRSHDESIAIVDGSTGEITAVANDGRTYVDIVTQKGTAVVKVMVGNVDDGDEEEVSPIKEKKITPPEPVLNLETAILGQWIWDGAYWESMKFLGNGKVYYSNYDKARGIYNEDASGEYTINKSTNMLTLRVMPTGGTQMTVEMAMISISKYSFTAKFYAAGQSTGTYTYAKQIGSIELMAGEKKMPKYKEMVESGTVVTRYKSHNTNIVEVDSKTGKITAKMTGKTYVDVVTEYGTAVVEVNVLKDTFVGCDYENYIGATFQKIEETFGDNYFMYSSSDMIYDYSSEDNNWSLLWFTFDLNTNTVRSISLLAKDNVWFTPEEMTQHLSRRFYVYEKGSEEDFKAFINAEKLEDATVGITWDMTNVLLTYVIIPPKTKALAQDYSSFLGKTRGEFNSLLKHKLNVEY